MCNLFQNFVHCLLLNVVVSYLNKINSNILKYSFLNVFKNSIDQILNKYIIEEKKVVQWSMLDESYCIISYYKIYIIYIS